MPRQWSLVAEAPVSALLAPAADAAGRTSRYAWVGNVEGKFFVVVHINQGNAATVAVSLLQAKDSSGTGSKAISANAMIYLQNTAASADASVQQANAASYTTDATTVDKIIVFEVLPEACLDIANGFNHIAVQTGASNAANITEAILLLDARINAIGTSYPTTFQ